MQEEFARRSVRQSAASLEDYLSDLNLEVEIRPPLETEWPRIAQLTQRTNQFNLSLKRRTLEEVRAMANDGFVLALKARDRFGDYGLVGACVGIITEPGVCEIDTFLMSCRVLGRGVENSLLHAVAIYARQQGSELLAAPFIAGPRNQMVREFLARSGFREQGENRWELPITEIPDLPSHVSWVDAEPASPPETAATGGV